jgi:soluble lytic murein transglycosylase
MKKFVLLPTLLALIVTAPAYADQASSENYRRALAQIEAGHPDQAVNLAEHGHDSAMDKVITGYAMALPNNDFSFNELASFINSHPDWPGLKGILMIAEQKLPQGLTNDQVVNWFVAHAPLTPSGFYRFIDALEAKGMAQKASDLIRERWIERDFSGDEHLIYYSRFGNMLTLRDHYARLDRLLWANEVTAARQMYRYVGDEVRALAEARIGLANQLSGAESLVARVPANWQSDQGLLYERLRWRRKNNLDDAAIEILDRAPQRLVHIDAWWDERHIIIRRLLEKRDYRTAYRLAANNGLEAGQDFMQAEFLAGWLALRFLNQPDLARTHFDNMLQSATSPISRSRGAYWMGRTLEALGDRHEAEQYYESAAALNTTFYGHLAATRLSPDPMIVASPEPAIPSNLRQSFFARDVVRATESLYRLGYPDRAFSFFKAATDYASQRMEFFLLTELAYKLKRPDWAIKAAKAANQKNMIMAMNAYPILGMKLPSPPDPAFTHALIRQESLFNADAGSGVGAKGLMQLMPKTAQLVAKKLGIKYKAQSLLEPAYNVRLGTAYAAQMIGNYDGSYVLALAAYNAGPGRVHEWVSAYGDPRRGEIDPVDWIEMIPIYETRNYVQRVMENFEVYRARLNGGRASLTILQDLKR